MGIGSSKLAGLIPWTDERAQEAMTRYQAGESAREIAVALGGMTRNGVIGKLARMGVKRSAEAILASQRLGGFKGAEITRITRGHVKAAPKPPRPVRKPKPVPAPPSTPPPIGGVPFMRTGPHACKWCIEPVDAPAHAMMLVCGAPSVEGRPYCQAHCEAATDPRRRHPVKMPYEGTVRRA